MEIEFSKEEEGMEISSRGGREREGGGIIRWARKEERGGGGGGGFVAERSLQK